LRFDLHLRSLVRDQLQTLAGEMQSWQAQSQIGDSEAEQIRQSVSCFQHTTSKTELQVAGVDGSGDFPMLSYADSFVYLSLAQGVIYESNPLTGLREMPSSFDPILEFHWIPENDMEGTEAFDRALEQLGGAPLIDVIQQSDYCQFKCQATGKNFSAEVLLKGLIRPHASDTANIAIQLRSTAEMKAALQIILGECSPKYVLVDTTFSLPLVSSRSNSLFHEHLKRLCCVEARKRGIGFFALSKSHGLPAIDKLESLVAQVQGLASGTVAEHWYLRIPEVEREGWNLSVADGRRLPPVGAVSYLVKFHRTTPVMRLDMDVEYWRTFIWDETEVGIREKERQVFEDLDYTCHDQRVYGYPYPLKAAHDRASLTSAERVAFRKQLIAAAMEQGMSPVLFRDPSQATGHR
jgi:hypothetical protein